MKPETARWLERAAADLSDARVLLQHGTPGAAGFHAQQAAEKAIKAVLVERSGRYPRIHDLAVLAREAGAPAEIQKLCGHLSPAYVAARYPDAGAPPSTEEGTRLVAVAQEVVAWARQQLS
ncbi:MAG TPA: HEPN domain-containing protein [Candidatus Thermoplasmatota archaeon]